MPFGVLNKCYCYRKINTEKTCNEIKDYCGRNCYFFSLAGPDEGGAYYLFAITLRVGLGGQPADEWNLLLCCKLTRRKKCGWHLLHSCPKTLSLHERREME
ncbi:hypothetical protein CEXT_266341 [Caerostris extrusa]|uniref:Uncharacterized protein n=1 Tax=Caerostris extrusa TaxID=172846 RepID=A0AAV4QM43_CAEEX|nr:hypothetical protein CEXT_266341 [Caerostris extrusa]